MMVRVVSAFRMSRTSRPEPSTYLTPFAMWPALPGSRGALLLPSPLRTAHESFPSCSSSLSFAPGGTRFRHGQTSVMNLSVAVGMEEHKVVQAVTASFRSPDDVMAMPSFDLGD